MKATKNLIALALAALLVLGCTACADTGAADTAEADTLRAEIAALTADVDRLTAENKRLTEQAAQLADELAQAPSEPEQPDYTSFTGYITSVDYDTDTAVVTNCEGIKRSFQGFEDLLPGDLVTMIYIDPAKTWLDSSDDLLVAVHYTGYYRNERIW